MNERLGGCAIAAMLLSAGAATAADIPVPVRQARAPAAVYDWSGIYFHSR